MRKFSEVEDKYIFSVLGKYSQKIELNPAYYELKVFPFIPVDSELLLQVNYITNSIPIRETQNYLLYKIPIVVSPSHFSRQKKLIKVDPYPAVYLPEEFANKYDGSSIRLVAFDKFFLKDILDSINNSFSFSINFSQVRDKNELLNTIKHFKFSKKLLEDNFFKFGPFVNNECSVFMQLANNIVINSELDITSIIYPKMNHVILETELFKKMMEKILSDNIIYKYKDALLKPDGSIVKDTENLTSAKILEIPETFIPQMADEFKDLYPTINHAKLAKYLFLGGNWWQNLVRLIF